MQVSLVSNLSCIAVAINTRKCRISTFRRRNKVTTFGYHIKTINMTQEQTAVDVLKNGTPSQQKTTLIPSISFNGRCNEAFVFYQQCFGGELSLMRWKDTPLADRCPKGKEDEILHAALTNDQLVLMGSDMTAPTGHVHGNNVSVCVDCSTEEEINRYFSKLSEGGTVADPLSKKFWGDLFGVVVDRFGIVWMLNYQLESCN